MPRKTKEINEEKNVKKQSKLNEKISALIQNVLEPIEKVVDVEKPSKKSKTKSASTSSTKSTKTTKKATKKVLESEEKAEEKISKKTVTKNPEKEKSTTGKNKKEKATTKRVTKGKEKANKEDKDEKATIKKASKVTKSTNTKTTKSKTTSKSESTRTSTAKSKTNSAEVAAPTIVEYYDLPYKYNQTVVKVLYQNPTTLFVYWEISDSDIENYKRTYGENFFETTRPVLVVYNDTMNYHFEVDINDFANSWYFNIHDSKCDYRVELIRRPVFYNEKIKSDYVYISSSNKIESPNDRILFSTDEPYTVYFRNTKNNHQRKVNLPKLLEQLNLKNKEFGFPIVRNVYDLYKYVYQIEDTGEFSVSLTNPSSGNPSSHSLSSRFI